LGEKNRSFEDLKRNDAFVKKYAVMKCAIENARKIMPRN